MDLTVENFQSEVLDSSIPVLVDFWAVWCGPCKMIAPIINELESEYEGKAKVFKVNVDEQTPLASKYGIMSIPTLLLFKNGEIVEKLIGARSKAELKSIIDKHL